MNTNVINKTVQILLATTVGLNMLYAISMLDDRIGYNILTFPVARIGPLSAHMFFNVLTAVFLIIFISLNKSMLGCLFRNLSDKETCKCLAKEWIKPWKKQE